MEKKRDIDKMLEEKLQQKEAANQVPTPKIRRASGTQIFDLAEQARKTKTGINEKQTLEEAEKKVHWSRPYDTYGKKLRREGTGFEPADILNYFIKFDSIVEDSKSRNFKDCIDRNIQDCQNESIIKERCKQGLISPSERDMEIEKIMEKRESFLHYTAIAYLGFYTARYDALKDNPEISEENRKSMKSEIKKMHEMTIKMAIASFRKHNNHIDQKIIEHMCREKGTAYNIFIKTICELADLFAKHFTNIPDKTRLSYHEKMQGPTIQTALSQLEYLLDLPHLVSTVPARNRLKTEILSANYQKEPTATD